MSIKRKQVGDAERYHGRRLHSSFMGPDLLANVDEINRRIPRNARPAKGAPPGEGI
jgi:hypothetical protein